MIDVMHQFTGNYPGVEFVIDPEDARSGYHQGQCDADIAALLALPYLAEQLARIPAESLRKELREYGSWDDAELQDHAQNLARILWLACAESVETED